MGCPRTPNALAVHPPQKTAAFYHCSEQDDSRFRFGLGRPRAAAHVWGRGARILTEINRLPHSFPALQRGFRKEICNFRGSFPAGAGTSSGLTRPHAYLDAVEAAF